MSLLRPSSIIFSLIVAMIMIFFEIKNILRNQINRKLKALILLIFTLTFILSFYQLLSNKCPLIFVFELNTSKPLEWHYECDS